MSHLWCNGQWQDALDFSVSHTDRGLMLGLGLFETILAVDGRLIYVERHLARLLAGCARLGWQPNLPDLAQVSRELLGLNDLSQGRARIRLSMTAGSGQIHDHGLGPDHVIWITASPAADAPEITTANIAPWPRNERSALASLKCASYAENLIALDHAARLGFEETLFLNTAGHLCEAATSNLFLVTKSVLLTPSLTSGCLPGVTRSVLIELAGKLGISCEELDLTPADLQLADEVFLTSSIRGVMGVSRLVDRILPLGPITRMLRDAWLEAINRNRTAD